MLRSMFRAIAMIAFVAASIGLFASGADARIGNGLSLGSRGGRTFSAPPPTSTAPSAAPFQRSTTLPGSNTGRPAAPAYPGGFFGRPGLFGGLMAGFLGAGLFGLLFGHGFLGGVGGLFSFLGLIFQLLVVVVIARFLWNRFQRRNQPAYAGRYQNDYGNDYGRSGSMLGSSGGNMPHGDAVGITGHDYDDFERLLGEIQAAYGAENIAALRARMTPECLSYFSEDLAQNASRGMTNRVANVKLLQGDLSEAWREGDTEYATVAMRFAMNDWMVDRSGQVVQGDPARPEEVTELWTFRRSRGGGPWILSAIQQTR